MEEWTRVVDVGVHVEVEGGGSWADGPTDDECMRPCWEASPSGEVRGKQAKKFRKSSVCISRLNTGSGYTVLIVRGRK